MMGNSFRLTTTTFPWTIFLHMCIISCSSLDLSAPIWKRCNSLNRHKSNRNPTVIFSQSSSFLWSSLPTFDGSDADSTPVNSIPFYSSNGGMTKITTRNAEIKELQTIVNSNDYFPENAVPIQIRKITIKKSTSEAGTNKIMFQRRPLEDKQMTNKRSQPHKNNISTPITAKTNKIKLEWIAESAQKLFLASITIATPSPLYTATATSAEQIVAYLFELSKCGNAKDIVAVGQKIRQTLNLDQQNENENYQDQCSIFHHRDLLERLIKACSIVGLVDISLKLLFHMLLVQNHVPDSKAYIPLLQCLRKRGQVTKMKYTLDKLSEACETPSNTTEVTLDLSNSKTTVDVVAFNVYLAALCEDVLQEGRPTATLPLQQRLQQAIDLLKPGIALKMYNIYPDVYSYNTVLNAVSQAQGWNNKTSIIDNIQKWMAITAANYTAITPMKSRIEGRNDGVFSGDIVTINALIRGHIESGDINSALDLIDEHILLDKLDNPSPGGSKKYVADRFTIDLAIQPLLLHNRTSNVLQLIWNYANSVEARSIAVEHSLADIFSAFLTRISIGARNPALAEKILHMMYDEKDSSNIPPPSTRHYNVVIEGYRRLLSRQASSSSAVGEEARSDGIEAARLWRTMISRGVLPDKYTFTSAIAQYSLASDIKQTWTESVQFLGIHPTEVICTSLISQLGQVGDCSASCAVFDWMLYCDKNGRTLPRKLRIWNALLGALVSRKHLSHTLNISLTEAVETWLRYNRTKSQLNILSCLGDQCISKHVSGMKHIDAAKFIFNMMLSGSKNDSTIPPPDSQTFCLMAAALSRQAEQTNLFDGIPEDKHSDRRRTIAAEAIELFKLSVQEEIPADGRFLNAIIRCFGGDVSFAIEAWKRDIGRVARAYNRKKKFDGGIINAGTTGNNNLMVSFDFLIFSRFIPYQNSHILVFVWCMEFVGRLSWPFQCVWERGSSR